MNVVCVKWGDKFSSDYVNKLYSMVSRNLPTDFTMYCYTDDPTGIDSNINIINIETDLEAWWLKIDLFGMFTKGETILFDLDIVILNPLINLTNLKTRKLTVMYARWKEGFLKPSILEKNPTLYNSSIVKWTDDQGVEIYDYFYKHKDKILLTYQGVDRYLFNEPVEVDLLPTSIGYSYWKGAMYKKDSTPEKYRGDYEVCILNHNPKPHEIDSWIHEYWK